MRKLFLFLILLVMLSSSAMAQGFCFPPYSVFGKYLNPSLSSAFVVVTLHDGQDSTQVVSINSNNEYSTDLANFPNCYKDGQTGVIRACLGDPECTKTFTVVSGSKVRQDFIFETSSSGSTTVSSGSSSGGGGSSGGSGGSSGGSVTAWGCGLWTECVDGKQSRSCTNNYGTTSKETKDCLTPVPEPTPVVVPEPEPVVPVTKYVCSDGTTVDVKENCPIESKEHEEVVVKKLLSLKTAGLAGAAIIACTIGLYLWRRRKGKFATAEKGAKTFIDKRTK